MFYTTAVLATLLASGSSFTLNGKNMPSQRLTLKMAQDYLEAEPYYDQTGIPMQLFKAKEPHVGKY